MLTDEIINQISLDTNVVFSFLDEKYFDQHAISLKMRNIFVIDFL